MAKYSWWAEVPVSPLCQELAPAAQLLLRLELGMSHNTLLFTVVPAGFFKEVQTCPGCRISSLAYQRPRNLGFLFLRAEHLQGAHFRCDLSFVRGSGCQVLRSFQLSGNRESSTKQDFICETKKWFQILESSSSQTQKHPITFSLPFQTPFFLVRIHTCFSASLNKAQETDTTLPNTNF